MREIALSYCSLIIGFLLTLILGVNKILNTPLGYLISFITLPIVIFLLINVIDILSEKHFEKITRKNE